MAADAHSNFAYSTVATAPSPATSGTSLVVAAGEGTYFPAVPFNATIWPAFTNALVTNAEIVRVTNISTDTLTITRAQESTSARSVIVGDQISATITDKVLVDAENPVRTTATYTTGSLASNARETGVITLNKGYRILKIQTDRTARVRLYATTTDRDADTTRSIGVDPTGDAGVMFDFVTTPSILTWRVTPLADGAQMSGSPTTSIPITVDNLDTITSTVAVTLTYIATES